MLTWELHSCTSLLHSHRLLWQTRKSDKLPFDYLRLRIAVHAHLTYHFINQFLIRIQWAKKDFVGRSRFDKIREGFHWIFIILYLVHNNWNQSIDASSASDIIKEKVWNRSQITRHHAAEAIGCCKPADASHCSVKRRTARRKGAKHETRFDVICSVGWRKAPSFNLFQVDGVTRKSKLSALVRTAAVSIARWRGEEKECKMLALLDKSQNHLASSSRSSRSSPLAPF
jgi:hypothetical protein